MHRYITRPSFGKGGFNLIYKKQNRFFFMIEVFKTNVNRLAEAQLIVNVLTSHLPTAKINFDLEDCDKILRVESSIINLSQIVELTKEAGFYCEVLD
jgi:hypothetical protein